MAWRLTSSKSWVLNFERTPADGGKASVRWARSYPTALRQRIADDDVKFVVLRLKRVRHPDVVCIERIEHFLREESARGVTILLAGVRPDTLGILHNVGIQSWFPEVHIFPEEDEEFSATLKAVRHARGHLDPVEVGRPPAKPIDLDDPPDLYYLV